MILVPYVHTWKCIPAAISGGVDMCSIRSVGDPIVTTEFSVRVTKIISQIGVF